MPSLRTLTGRPSPMAWPDPAAMAEQPKTSNVRRSQWPFLVQGEEDIAGPQPQAKAKAEAAWRRGQSPAPAAAPAASGDSRVLAAGSVTATSISAGAVPCTSAPTAGVLAAGALMANEIARRTYDAAGPGSIDAATLVHDNLTATTISVKSITAGCVAGVFPGALHADSVTAAWAMSNGLGHLVRKS